MASPAASRAWTLLLVVVLVQAVHGVLRGPAPLLPPWPGVGDDAVLQDAVLQDAVLQDADAGVHYADDAALQRVAEEEAPCRGLWTCVRRDLADSLVDILTRDEYNVTSALAVQRIRPREDGVDVDRMAVSLNEAGLPTLASTAIKVFETHALVWKLWPGMLHFKIFRDPAEGMDAAVEVPPDTGSRTWGLAGIAARRRLTMALLPIMYKMGVGTTLLGVLVFIALKTMFMTSILFVLAVSSFAKHKLSALAQHQPVHYAPPPHQPHKEVHVHVHADPHKQAYGGGWHRHGSHLSGHPSIDSGYHPVYPPYQSGPPSDEYYEPEPHPQAYYHRRVGGASLGHLGQQVGQQVGHFGRVGAMSRWDSVPASATAAEPAFYSGTYSR